MTPKQITNALLKAGIDTEELDIQHNEIIINCGYFECDGIGHVDSEKVEEMCKQIQEVLPQFNGGFNTRYGASVLRIGYRAPIGDWNDVSSEHHY